VISPRLSFDLPGKCMFAGEYAVLRGGGVAVACAIKGVGHARVMRDERAVSVRVSAYGNTDFRVTRSLFDIEPDTLPGLLRFAWAGARIAATGLDLAEMPFHLALRLDRDASGKKVGLGGSAVATLAGVKAVALAAQVSLLDPAAAELAHVAHRACQHGHGSGYDVATIVRRGVVRFDQSDPPHSAPLLARAQTLPWPRGLHAVLAFSGESRNTGDAITRIQADERALGAIDEAARAVAEALESEEPDAFLAAIEAAEVALERADGRLGLGLTTGLVGQRLAEIREAGCTGRVSGAGGGDSVLAFAATREPLEQLCETWRRAGVRVVARLPEALDAPDDA